MAIGDRIRSLIENAYVVHEELRINVTISIGATLARTDDTVDSLVKRADKLLYQSGKTGRNRLSSNFESF